MQFPEYHLYVAVISQRDQAVLIIAIFVLFGLETLALIRQLRPAWLKAASWSLIGVFYATLLALAYTIRAGA